MATSGVEILELYRLSPTNAASQPAIAPILDEFGHGPEKFDDALSAHHGMNEALLFDTSEWNFIFPLTP